MDEADIFFLIDHSGSIHPTEFQDMKNFMIEFLNMFRIGPQHVRIGVVKFADSPELQFDLETYSDAKSVEDGVINIQQIGGGTMIGEALKSMAPYFDRAAVSRGHKVKEYLVVVTDGNSTDKVKAPADKLRSQNIVVFAIGVKSADEQQLLEISGDPDRTFFVNNFDALRPIKDEIVTDICLPDGKHIHVLNVVLGANPQALKGQNICASCTLIRKSPKVLKCQGWCIHVSSCCSVQQTPPWRVWLLWAALNVPLQWFLCSEDKREC